MNRVSQFYAKADSIFSLIEAQQFAQIKKLTSELSSIYEQSSASDDTMSRLAIEALNILNNTEITVQNQNLFQANISSVTSNFLEIISRQVIYKGTGKTISLFAPAKIKLGDSVVLDAYLSILNWKKPYQIFIKYSGPESSEYHPMKKVDAHSGGKFVFIPSKKGEYKVQGFLVDGSDTLFHESNLCVE